MFVFKAGVVGAGVMGGEISQVIAAAGIPVVLKDVHTTFVDAGLQKAREVTEGQVAKLVKKGKISEEDATAQADRTLSLITGTTDYDGFGDVDFVIEAVPEKMEIKHAVFAELDAATPGHAILASNTSGLSITEIGDATNRPDKVVGFHFFWPASYMRLIEVIEGEDTAPETTQAAANFAQAIKKMPVRCHECPGFVVNRILVSTASEIWRYQDEDGDRRRAARPVHHREGPDADGPVPGGRHVRPGHRREGRARHARGIRRPLLRAPGHGVQASGRRARRQDREGVL
jgi:3-hydroxyacyl-CoA dehydrogenase